MKTAHVRVWPKSDELVRIYLCKTNCKYQSEGISDETRYCEKLNHILLVSALQMIKNTNTFRRITIADKNCPYILSDQRKEKLKHIEKLGL